MDTDSFIVYLKTDNIYKYIAEDVETRFDTSNYELDRPLPKRKKENVIGLIKYELGGRIMKKFVGLRANAYSYLIDENKKAKTTKKSVIKRKLRFQNYKNCLEATQLDNIINLLYYQVELLLSSLYRKQKIQKKIWKLTQIVLKAIIRNS